jgi:uncharacterized membrane protein
MLGFKSKTKYFLSQAQKQAILNAIKHCESNNSGEVRIFIEAKCSYVNPLDRAEEIFNNLGMHKTQHRNGVLIYIAYKHKEFCVYGDAGCIQRFAPSFWQQEVRRIQYHFAQGDYTQGIISSIEELHNQFLQHYPHKGENKNELPDDIIFGD